MAQHNNPYGLQQARSGGTQIVRFSSGGNITMNLKGVSLLLGVLVLSNLLTFSISKTSSLFKSESAASPQEELYLMEKASMFVHDDNSFEQKVRSVANELNVPPEWLMAVMYAESGFDASVANHKGSGAVGLIQWMPTTAKEYGTTVEKLQTLNHVEQLNYVYLYFKTVKERYGDFNTLTDFYLAVLYPKAIGQDYCYTLYATPSQAYKQNSGLDEDKDGRVTIRDVDVRMRNIFHEAYVAGQEEAEEMMVENFRGFRNVKY